jgi:hypothetical protein
MVYYAYGSVIKFIKVLDVSSVERIEIEYEDADMENIKGIYSLTCSSREYIGDEIRWDEEGCDTFKIYNNGRNINNDSDTEEEEEEEEEEGEPINIEALKKRQGLDEDDGFIKFLRDKQAKKKEEEEYIGEPGSLNYLFGIPLAKGIIVG